MASLINLKPILDQLGKQGLPVRFIRESASTVERGREDEDEFGGLFSKSVKLSPQVLDSLKNVSPKPPFNEFSAIQTLYHEATHAFFFTKSKDLQVAKVIASGEKWYAHAPFAKGGAVTKPDKVFMEAAAMYVGHRASSWWRALETLTRAESSIDRLQQMHYSAIVACVKDWLQIANAYNKAMAERVFGYQQVGNVQVHVSKSMPGDLKTFCDVVLLENKIPDQFDRVQAFAGRYKKLLEKLKPFEQAPRTVPGGGGYTR